MTSGVLPAYAGMIRGLRRRGDDVGGAPRVCGDDPPYDHCEYTCDLVLPAYAGMIR